MTERHRSLCEPAGIRQPESPRTFRFALGIFLLGGVLSLQVCAQEEEPATVQLKPSWRIAPNAKVDFTYTDNVAPGQGAKTGDFITRLAPGIKVDGKSARASGSLDYKWQQNLYADNSQLNNHQQSLRANGKLELVEQWMFIDASANIAQRPTSAFGMQGIGNELISVNRTETTAYQWSPYVQGQLGGKADYELRYNNSHTTANTGVIASYGGTTSEVWSARLTGASPWSILGWSVNTEQQNVELGSVRKFETTRFSGTLEFRVAPQVRFFVNAGRERDNFSQVQWQQRATSGYGADWSPTERTLLSLKQDRRSYGNSHSLTLKHRTALTVWTLSDARSVNLPGQQMTQAPIVTAYQLLDSLLLSQPGFSDPFVRAQTVGQLLGNVSPDTLIYGNIMSSQAMTQRRQEASIALMGANNTVTLTLQRSSSQRLTSSSVALLAGDDFALTTNIRQTGLNGTWTHKLSPHSTLTLNALSSRSQGGTSSLETRLRSLNLMLTTKLGEHTTATAGLRQTSFDTTSTNSYDEQAVMGSLLVTF